eukprot:TRINITY_DN6206_c0_g1_i2.p1 TRINITY_DN6206_c0_g1~~TRINITY_DN6206_c0_g1_i2.p1  ORF type:complete len:783 (-),score=168.07 TRINITY_DN6206_c0_g1_i2:74-2422(-)
MQRFPGLDQWASSIGNTTFGALDQWLSRVVARRAKIFSHGWGEDAVVERVHRLSTLLQLPDGLPPPHTEEESALLRRLFGTTADVTYTSEKWEKHNVIIEGEFSTPAHDFLPPASHRARFQLILPRHLLARFDHVKPPPPSNQNARVGETADALEGVRFHRLQEDAGAFPSLPLVFHYSATGDHGYFRRRQYFARPLAKEGVASLLLESPFYGSRKPTDQVESSLRHVTDLMTMGIGIVSETAALMRHFSEQAECLQGQCVRADEDTFFRLLGTRGDMAEEMPEEAGLPQSNSAHIMLPEDSPAGLRASAVPAPVTLPTGAMSSQQASSDIADSGDAPLEEIPVGRSETEAVLQTAGGDYRMHVTKESKHETTRREKAPVVSPPAAASRESLAPDTVVTASPLATTPTTSAPGATTTASAAESTATRERGATALDEDRPVAPLKRDVYGIQGTKHITTTTTRITCEPSPSDNATAGTEPKTNAAGGGAPREQLEHVIRTERVVEEEVSPHDANTVISRTSQIISATLTRVGNGRLSNLSLPAMPNLNLTNFNLASHLQLPNLNIASLPIEFSPKRELGDARSLVAADRRQLRIPIGPFCFSGLSLGGHMAAMCGSMWREPSAVVPCVAPFSAAPVFANGVLREWCDWERLASAPPPRAPDGLSLDDHFASFLTPSDITKYAPPVVPECAIQVSASSDGYIPGTGVHVHEHWKGSELRWVPGGHVSSFVVPSALRAFRCAILDSLWRLHLLLYEGVCDEIGSASYGERARSPAQPSDAAVREV